MAKRRAAREKLSLDRILASAVTLADEVGLEQLSMRRLGQALGVEAMSLYNHVANKHELLDGLIDRVVGEIELPRDDDGWKLAMRKRVISAYAMLERHPWAIGLMESRTDPGPVTLRYYDAVLGCLRRAGFTVALAGHAFSALDSYLYGFALQHSKGPLQDSEELAAVATDIVERMPADEFPYLVEFTAEHVLQPGYDFGDEFEYGLDLILDGLERVHSAAR